MTFQLHPHQADVLAKLDTGKVLVGGTGSGKSITALAYAEKVHPEKRIVVITTAKKRDTGEWYGDAMKMSLRQELHADSWNNIGKYVDDENTFFIFDEQKLVGSGAWVKHFYEIAKRNPWILLSATPADTWMDLCPLFIANGFYRNKTDFTNNHVRYSRYSKYPKVDGYLDTWLLERYRRQIYVEMPFTQEFDEEDHFHEVGFDLEQQKLLYTARWNFYDQVPLKDAGEMTRLMRKSTNAHISRYEKVKEILAENPRAIIFYNHNPELEQLRCLMTDLDIPMAEWNGHVHQDVPTGDRWVYLVQYQAGGEGWNCITTDTVIMYTLPYSYRNFKQAKGRIARLNTPFPVLHYHILKSRSIIDRAIWAALSRKKNFQKSAFARKTWPKMHSPTRLIKENHPPCPNPKSTTSV